MKRAMKKINKGEPLQETLEVFLATYRSTPSRTTDQKSPSELMFGRRMRTTLDLLRPTQIAETVNVNSQQRHFSNGDLVYVQVHAKRLVLGTGHVNQIRPRYNSANTEAELLNKHLPLSVLLEEVGIKQQPTEPSPEAVNERAQEQLNPDPGPDRPSVASAAPTRSRIPTSTATYTSRGREVRLPARFNHYV
ncbi:uncharacterized protein K02A2.6-like [Sabethes cyaneus]|uniref:uncharacterized protein K02A2.6-like n=1 Tax=Sabethes cyaneus TaxID=53552 RepID=UPI00237ED730|nr:uncharacterized protein K02A2.6-like [Sabethes cyaneus]